MKLYETIAEKVQYAINDTDIFRLTGCLSKCDKYHFKASGGVLQERPSPKSMLMIAFLLRNGRNELKEQVGDDHACTSV